MDYNNVHITLLTYIRSLRAIKESDLENAYTLISQKLTPQDSAENKNLERIINEINVKINPTGFMITKQRSQVEDDIYYIFINNTSDALIRGNTVYSVTELDVLKTIIDDIVQSSDRQFSVGQVNASQRISNMLNRSNREAKELLQQFVDDGWFDITQSRVVLSIRFIAELKHYLIERYGMVGNDEDGIIYSCFQCKDLVTQGTKCTYCPISFHYRCLNFYTRTSPNCPSCGTSWVGDSIGLQLPNSNTETNI